jgi:hypothetical protein
MENYYDEKWPQSPDFEVYVKPKSGTEQKLRTAYAHQHQPESFNYDELESFARWDYDGKAHIRIVVKNDNIKMQNVVVRPRRAQIAANVSAGERTVSFTIDTSNFYNRMISVEVDGSKRPFFLFTDPAIKETFNTNETNVGVMAPSQSDDEVITEEVIRDLFANYDTLYFPKGIYNIHYFNLKKDNQTWYFEDGAVLRLRSPEINNTQQPAQGGGSMKPTHESGIKLSGKGVRILGRGIIDGKYDTDNFAWPLVCHGFALTVRDSTDVVIDGLTMTHSLGFCLVAQRSKNVEIRNIKLLGSQDMTSNDGILIDSCTDSVVEHCFVNNHDDSLEVKTHYTPEYGKIPLKNAVFQKCVVWCRGGMSLGATWTNWADIRDVCFKDISIIHHDNYGIGDLCVYVGDQGTVSDIVFEDIDIEETAFGGIAITLENHPWTNWGSNLKRKFYQNDADFSLGNPNENWPYLGNVTFRNITMQYCANYDSDFYPRPKLPANGSGHGGRGFKLHVPMPEFSSGNTVVTRPHLVGQITFENVWVADYSDNQDFSRFGKGEDHCAGRMIQGHYLSDLVTDRWILWEGENQHMWTDYDPENNAHSPRPDFDEMKERVKFWESKVKFIFPK